MSTKWRTFIAEHCVFIQTEDDGRIDCLIDPKIMGSDFGNQVHEDAQCICNFINSMPSRWREQAIQKFLEGGLT